MGMRPQAKLAPSVLLKSMVIACVCMAVVVRTFHPISLNAPPKPSHFCAGEVSLTVTVAVPVDVVAVAVVQYAPGAEVITFIVTAVPPVPVDPPVAAPPVPVLPPVPAFPAMPPVPVEPPVLLPPVPVPPVPVLPPVPVVTLSTQALLAQCWVAVQACPQEPQFAVLLVVSTQAVLLHRVWPLAQLEPQLLLLQTWPVVQVIEQLPQWVASDATQEPLQKSCPDAHWHWLFWQVCPPEQALPQTPQLLESEAMFTHAEPQSICPELQVMPVPPVPLPPVPVPLLPPVPPPVCAPVQAAVRIAKPRPKSHTRAVVVITTYIPGQTETAAPCGEL